MEGSGFWRWAQRFLDVVLLGALWLITSLPLITVGAASYALHGTMSEYVADERPVILRRYFQLFRTGFGPATRLWLVHLAAFAVLALDLAYYWYGESRMDTLRFVLLATAASLLALEFNMCFICLSQRPEGKLWATVRYAFDLAMTCFWQTLAVAVLSLGLPAAAALLLPESVILTPGISCWLCWQLLPDMFRKYRFKKNARDHRRDGAA